VVKYRLTNYLICPECRHTPLSLNVIEKTYHKNRDIDVKPCDFYCAYLDKREGDIENPPCRECMKYEVVYGYFLCSKCGEWYPIIDKIAIMHRGKYRPRKAIIEFIEKYRDMIPDNLVRRELSREKG